MMGRRDRSHYLGLNRRPACPAACSRLTRSSRLGHRTEEWVVIAGNALWVAGSVPLLVDGLISPNVVGYVFVGGQAAAVAVLAELEYFGLRQTLAIAH
jgi:hypothetical protein